MSSRALLLARVVAVVAAAAALAADAQLSPAYYNTTCPGLPSIVRRGMAQAVQKEARMGASILRLFFHDCFVNKDTCCHLHGMALSSSHVGAVNSLVIRQPVHEWSNTDHPGYKMPIPKMTLIIAN
ncbi:hypothetical protein ABZP36_025013 [Zizania latifolia]